MVNSAASDLSVSLVMPARNAGRTLGACLEAVVQIMGRDGLEQIIVVDDGSTDHTAEIADQFSVQCVRGPGKGPGAARNVGWRAARGSLVWFVDADCVAEPETLQRLLRHLKDDSQVAGAGGSYTNMCPNQLLACLVHDEIIQRHQTMPAQVNYLATFNVVYRRSALEQVGGFDEKLVTAEDADLAFRLLEAGYRLQFDPSSRVGHFHPVRLLPYLHAQRQHGYWRMRVYARHPRWARGDSYSGLLDHIQPPLAVLSIASMPLLIWPILRWIPLGLALGLLLIQIPMTVRIVRHTRSYKYTAFAALAFIRAYWRGAGMCAGLFHVCRIVGGSLRDPQRHKAA